MKDFTRVVVDSSGLLQLPSFKKVADTLRDGALKKNEILKVAFSVLEKVTFVCL